jgi:hypothetical protein
VDAKATARRSPFVECDYIFELVEAEIDRTSSILERLDLYRSSRVCYEALWRWATRSDNKYEFCCIMDALGCLKSRCTANREHVGAHQKVELEHAEGRFLQALHFTKRVHDYQLCMV